MNTYSVSRLALALAFGVTLSACSSTPADQQPSTQTAPGTASPTVVSLSPLCRANMRAPYTFRRRLAR